MKKNSNSQTKSGQKTKATKARGPVQRDSKEVIAELVAKLSARLGPKPAQENATEGKPKGAPAPNRDRLTVGVDLGDQWSNYCILGLEGGDADGRTVADNARGYGGILLGLIGRARDLRSGDAFGLGAGSGSGLRARGAGRQPASDGGDEASQAQE